MSHMTDSEVDASAREYYAAIADDKPLLELDATCPYCKRHSDISEAFDCSAYMVRGSADALVTGRQRTRALWRKRGRR